MKCALLLILFATLACHKSNRTSAVSLTGKLPGTSTGVPDHIFIVWFENKAFDQIIGNAAAPFINSLVAKGTLFTKSYALFHPSYPNYIAFFAGSNVAVNTDSCIAGAPLRAKTLYNSLHDAGVSFKWYSEGLPEAGSDTCKTGYYVERHNPTTIFSTVPASVNVPLASINLRDTTTFKDLPQVACITPNLMNDMHDGTVQMGDTWLQTNFSTLMDWCMKHNAVFVIYFDEDNMRTGNHIPVIMTGEHIKAAYQDTAYHDHYSFTKSLLRWHGADSTFTSNLANATTIQNIWK